MTPCVVFTDWEATERCRQPAVALVTTGCLHEHIEVEPMCAGHFADAQRLRDPDGLICTACGLGHDCDIKVLDTKLLDSNISK